MRITCLGSGDAFGTGGRLNTSFFIQTSNYGILLDCGATTAVALKKAGLSSDHVDIILISHLHGDHIGGIPFIITERKQPKGSSTNGSLVVIGPKGLEETVTRLQACFFPGIEVNDSDLVQFIEYRAEQAIHPSGMVVTAYPASHTPATCPHSLRVESDGVVIAYSGDTAWNDNLIRVSNGADLFICEGFSYEREVSQHMSIRKLIENRHRLSAGVIAVTHLGEEALAHHQDIPFLIAEDGKVLWPLQ
jgi:ribonuclease BN (tRNA processing enzyme)